MKTAEEWLARFRRNGHQVQADWNAPHLRLVNQHGVEMEHPAGLLPELLWLLRKQAPYKPPTQNPGLRWAPEPGGAA